LADGFRSVSPLWQERHFGAEQFTAWQARSREQQQEEARQDIAPKDMPPVTCFLQVGRNFCCLPIIYSDFECVNG
jgi:hypothetical protein